MSSKHGLQLGVGLKIDWDKFFADMNAVGGDPIAAAASLPIGKYLNVSFTSRASTVDADPDIETRPVQRMEWESP